MSAGWWAWRKNSIIAGCLLLALAVASAQNQKPNRSQKKPAASLGQAARATLAGKALALEARGRPDLAAQLWQEILYSDPNDTEALAGLAKDLKLTGAADQADQADQALDRLRAINPRDPNIAKIQAMVSSRAQSEQLSKAGELARLGKTDDAMSIYRQLYGDHPPDGDVGLAYYETLFGTINGKAEAIAGLRAMAARNPGDSRYAVALGAMLTYDQKTRAEGIRILQAHPRDPAAETALRQALIWDAANPSSAAQLRQYLNTHPQDKEVSNYLKRNEARLARMNSGIARTPAERAAFAALNGRRLDEAEKRFSDLLDQYPKNGRVAAGMGFLRMQQKNFGGAISYLSEAEQNGYKTGVVDKALATSRFWYTMGEATQAMDENQLDVASARFRAALAMNPRSPEALNGLAGLLTREQQYPAAAGVYEQLVKAQPSNRDGWRGLFLAYANDKQYARALAVSARIPAQTRASLEKDPEYLRSLATIYQAQNRSADAQRVLAQALALPFPDNGTTLKEDTKLQYAGILTEARRYDQAAALYVQVLAGDPSSVPAWMGLIAAHHELDRDTLALSDVKRMPSAAYESALADPGFLAMLGAIYQQANQFEIAQGFLERAEKIETEAGGKPSVSLQLQLAAIELQRNEPAQAYSIYRQVLYSNPERTEAWKGLITALQATHRNSEALQEIAQIPASPRKELESDIDFLQLEAGIYAATGDTGHAIQYMNRVEAFFAKQKELPPAGIEIQNAWLLYNTNNDRALYPELIKLGGRTDLTAAQKETVQDIWANWSVRRAAEAMDNGNLRRAVQILEAASQAFPNNLAVRKAVAGGFAQVGRAKEALALFKTVPMQDASSGDFQGAINAALAANDKSQAETWLRQALDRYPRDPAILSLAARYEQARGDNQRAADYYRASLAAMPQVSPADRLAHVLVYPEQDERTHKAVTAADLQRLLNPDNEPFAKVTKLAPLPAYGHDPYDGSAPVVLPAPQSASPQGTQITPATGQTPATGTQPASGAPSEVIPFSPSSQVEDVFSLDPQPVSSGGTGAGKMGAAQVAAAPATGADPDSGQYPDIVPNPPHSLASDTWKGLIFSLMADRRNAEAVQQLGKIPPDVRRQLEADIEFVQGIASLYVAVGDTAHAATYLNRVENYYLLHRASAPAGLEIQHAWLLYNTGNDAALYPVLQRLDRRKDLTDAQRQEISSLWASWAVRRANAAMERGNMVRGVEILQAASQDYPDNLTVRRAVAGAYARVGRSSDAVTLFKTLPMENASSGDYQGAISAAMAVPDMAQAEVWLRKALNLYPSDPQILGLAARYEQARGNNERATAFWRAALAAMPPGSTIQSLDTILAFPPGAYHAPAPGDTKQLLDPRLDPLQTSPDRLAPAPYAPLQIPSQPTTAPLQSQPATTPSDDLAPMSSTTVPSARSSGAAGFTGQAHVPPSAENVASNSLNSAVETGQRSTQRDAAPVSAAGGSNPAAGLRITSQPMGSAAAQTQALFAEQTDSQLTQGSANLIHALPNAAVEPAATRQPPSSTAENQYTMAQYTPSAQEAATGAYSAPNAQTATPPPSQPTQSPQARQPVAQTKAKPSAATPASRKARKKYATTAKRRQVQLQTLGNAPLAGNPTIPQTTSAPPMQSAQLPGENTVQAEPPAFTTGLSDQELEERDLPPLRGPWVRTQRRSRALSPREQAEMQLAAIESGYSPWLGGSSLLNYRSGALGYDRLSAIEAPFEVSVPMGYHARFTVVAKPVFLDSGQADGTATISVLESTVSGTALTTIPEPIGTMTATSFTPPAQQNAAGIGGEVQLAFPQLSIAGGYTPAGFLVSTFTGRFQWRPGNGPFTISAVRDSQQDSQLSYAGLRDPAGNSLGVLGQIWGGVVYNQAQIQFAHGEAASGYYFSAGGQYLTGYHVKDNNRVDGNGGAYWRIFTEPEYGNLSIGANFFAMRYANNQDAFTHGMGGYFSPQAYFLANVPFTWAGYYNGRWHYNIVGALGVQAFQQNQTRLWPLAADAALETGMNNPYLPDLTSVGANYDIRSQTAYQLSPHWFAGAYLEANNTRNYNFASVGFYIRYLFRQQPSSNDKPTGIFPIDGLRPFTVP